MDQKIEARLAALEKQVAFLTQRNEFITQRLDEVRRLNRMSSIIDDQLVSINTRSPFMRGDAA